MLTQEKLKELLRYDESTGVFTWRISTGRVKAGDSAGSAQPSGYSYIRIETKRYQAHRLAWLYVHGHFPPVATDHINGVRNDNKLANLRAVTNCQNHQNRQPRKNSSGYRNICWDKATGTWKVKAMQAGKFYHGGRFVNLADAVVAAVALRSSLFTHHVEHVTFIDEGKIISRQ